MKPVAMFQFAPDDRPAYFVTYLRARSIPHRLFRLDQDEPVPADAAAFCGLALFGGPMSANDPLPWIGPVLALIRSAARVDVPVIGHCLGGQLLAKALGGVVTGNPVKEIGWGTVHIEDNSVAREWFGQRERFESFHWHGETFAVPPGAMRIASSAHCTNQTFACGPHLAMQCHMEIDEETVRTWCTQGSDEIAGGGPAVDTVGAMLERLPARLASLHSVSDRLYDRWIEGLRR